jgi:hypothetical protein
MDLVNSVDLFLIKANLRKINRKILLKEHYDLHCVNRLQTPTEQQGILTRERAHIAIADQEILYKLTYFPLFL